MKDSFNEKENSNSKDFDNQKNIYVPSSINSEIKVSLNPFQKQKDKNKNKIIFDYLQPYGNNITFDMEDGTIQNLYKPFKSLCKYVICILVKDDTYYNSQLLDSTLKGIKSNIPEIKQFLIEPENILICIFFNEFINSNIFNEDDITSMNKKNQFILSKNNYSIENNMLNVHCFSKLNYFSNVEILKYFYCIIVNQLREENSILFTSIITAGIFPSLYTLGNLIKLSYNVRGDHNIIIPLLEEEEFYFEDLIYKIKKYERIHFNIYNMNFYNMINSVPISSSFNIMTIDNNLFYYLNNYYKNIDINISIDFHDYNLSLYLFKYNFNIIYYNSKNVGIISYINYSENNLIYDYRDMWIKRYSGYYGNYFEIIRTFIDCNNFNIFKRIFLFFQIIGLLIEFIFPSLSCMVIYTILYEAFNTHDKRPAAFCTLIYIFILISNGACSLITKHSIKIQLTNLIFYFFIEIYYLFILICSIIAMDNVRKNKNNDSYKFNTKAITCIIILTIIPGILPMIFEYETIFNNIIPLLLYLVLGASPSSSSFYMAKILNSCESCGGQNINERKGIFMLIYILFNLFFGSLIFFNYNRKKRVETIMYLGIII